ncbi:MAG: branched-chain amino acid ABC transporter permease [Candidatus Liptonbacteria bacterium]|nr:branched-chain amino acid ABC transporter permease [Candidatus Liptonbacteria bacterium]
MAYLIHLLILFAIYGILGLSLNLVMGYTGLLSVTHGAFFGIGAYATAILMTHAGLNFFVALIVGLVLSGVVSFIIGAILSRLSGDYFVLGTVGLNYLIVTVLINWSDLTRGPLGIAGIHKPHFFGLSFSDTPAFLVLSLIFLALTFLVARFVVNSSFGRALKAIREDQKALQVFGYNIFSYKLAIFTISGALAAIAGALFASYITFINPASFDVMQSVFILAVVVLGGLGSLRGSLLGALLLVIIPELLRFVGFPSEIAAQTRQAIYGLLLVVLMLYRPQGLIGEYKL